MTLHKLHAGPGYTYLNPQVTAGDEGRSPGQQLADYDKASGKPPGRWVGEGLADLAVTGPVHRGVRLAPELASHVVPWRLDQPPRLEYPGEIGGDRSRLRSGDQLRCRRRAPVAQALHSEVLMSGTAVVKLLGPTPPSLWVGPGQTRTLVLADPALGPNNELTLMHFADVIALPEKSAQGGEKLSVTTFVENHLEPVSSGGTQVVRHLRYEVTNHNQSSGTFFTRMAILAIFAAGGQP